MIISAFYSGLRGGRLFADALIAFLEEKGLMDKASATWPAAPTAPSAWPRVLTASPHTPRVSQVPLIAQPFDPDESYLDEAIGYSLAAVGFSFQIFNGFNLPFPLNLVFLPLTIIEWFLRLQISMEGSKALV